MNSGIIWNGNWAYGCDFFGRDLSRVSTPAANCGPTCVRTRQCTHFAWTNFNGGSCWMKSGSVSKSNAFVSSTQGIICGVV